MSAGPAALVMAKAPRAGEVKTRLEPLLGPEGCARLQAALIGAAARWAQAVAPGAAFVAYAPDGAEEELRPLVPEGTRLFPQTGVNLGERLAAATAHVLGEHPGGPVLAVGTDAPTLRPEAGARAATQLADGADVTLGPALDGGYWLVGLKRPSDAVFAIESGAWGGEDVLELTVAAARSAGLRVELLHTERDLDRPEDARALLEDPALPPEVAAALRP